MKAALQHLQSILETLDPAFLDAAPSRHEAELSNIRKQIERAEREWLTAIDAVDELIFLYGSDFRILRCNRAYRQAAGIPFKEIIGRIYYEIFPPASAPLPDKNEDEIEVDGKIYRSRIFHVKDESGNRLYTAHTLDDITAHKQSEKDLQLFRALLDHSSETIEVIDPDTLYFLDVNENGRKSLGYSREELQSMKICDIDPTFDHKCDEKIKQQIQQNSVARFESLHQRKDGSTFPVEISAKLIQLDKPYGLNIVRDITERKKTEAELLRLNRVLKTLSNCNHTMLRAESEVELMQRMCEAIVASSGYALAWIGMVRQDADKTILPVALAGKGKTYVDTLNLTWQDAPQGNGPIGMAVRTGKTQVVHDAQCDSRFSPWCAEAKKYGFAAVVALPLKDKGTVFGTLNIYSSENSIFNDSEIVLLEEVADDLSYGTMALRTEELRDQTSQHLLASLEGTISAMAAMVETRDPYTSGHQHRVADLAQEIALKMNLPENDIHGIYLAAVIHDLGKIGIPAEILSKPGRLNALEFEIVQTHAQAGYDILKMIDFPWPIAQMVYQHHEHPDGSGYPNGLKDEQILPGAKIITVADTIEAMSSHRPYRPGLGLEAAFEEITRHRGDRYDPAVVDACLSLFREDGYKLPA